MNNGSIIYDTPPNTHTYIYTLAHHANHDVLHYIIKKDLIMAIWHNSQWSIYVSWLWFTEYLVNYTYKEVEIV